MDLSTAGIGVDIEDISRFLDYKSPADSHFLNKIFTGTELDYCFSKENPAPHLAVRFAAKEALIKALGSLGVLKIRHTDIEICNDKNGVPVINFNNDSPHQYTSKVSLSHNKEHAVAFVIIVEKTDHDRREPTDKKNIL